MILGAVGSRFSLKSKKLIVIMTMREMITLLLREVSVFDYACSLCRA
jgi:hypothetical protein